MDLVDTHTHLDDDAFAGDLDEVIEASRRAGVRRWINVGYNETRWTTTRQLAGRVDGMSFMLGLHPGNADEWSKDLHERLKALVREVAPVAIGEIGIDLYWRQDNLDLQRRAFAAQLDLAREAALPAVIHMRSADEALLDVLDSAIALPHLHFHSFDGDGDLRAWVLQNNATIGVSGLITRRGSDALQEWVARIPHDRVVLETDSPYLKPRGIRGKRNEPAFMPKVAKLLSDLWAIDIEDVAKTTTDNANRIFNIPEIIEQ